MSMAVIVFVAAIPGLATVLVIVSIGHAAGVPADIEGLATGVLCWVADKV